MRSFERSSRWTRRLGFAAIALAALVALAGYFLQQYRSSTDGPSEARRIAESVMVSGFTRTAVVDVLDRNSSYATAYFIGPAPKPDPLEIINVPSMELSATAPPSRRSQYLDPPTSEIVARGQRADECHATVVFDTSPRLSTSSAPPVQIVTQDQWAAVRSGAQVFIEVLIGDCGW